MTDMKQSGIEWVGEIPAHWNIHPVYFYFGERKRKNRFGQEENLLSLSYGKIIRKDINTSEGLLPESFNTYNIVENGDIIIRPTDLQNDKRSLRTGLVKERGIITSAYIGLMPVKKLDSRFFNYQLHAYDVIKVFYNMGNGVRQGLNYSEFSKLLIFEPPLSEQQRIADFLDGKCTEIDGLVADIQSQIDTLEQYKRSVITETVTKGLNPDAEMKDSGIDFIGDIPIMWQVLRMKNLGTYRNGLTYSPSDLCDETNGTLVFRSSNIQDGKLCFSDNVYVSTSIPQVLLVQKDDILICSRNGSQKLVGKNAIIPNNVSASFGAFMMVFRCNRKTLPKYAYYLLNSQVFSYYLATFFTSTINQLTGQNFGNMKIPFCPDIQYQRDIANYLDNKCTEIDSIIDQKKEQLTVLENYKKSLIYEYVTGKKEVPVQ